MTMTTSQHQAHLYATQNVLYAIASLLGAEHVLKLFEVYSEQMHAQLLNERITETSLNDYEAAAENWRRQLTALIPLTKTPDEA